MNLETEIKNILFEIGKEIKVHKLIDGNLIIEIDYDKYTIALMELMTKYGIDTEDIINAALKALARKG